VSAHRAINGGHQLAKAEGLQPDGIQQIRALAQSTLNSPRGQVVHMDGLQLVLAVAEEAEDRQPAQGPGDVVDQDIAGQKRTAGRRMV
jgi:hypothetical protein